MHCAVVLPLLSALSAHVPGISQGDVAVDHDGRVTTVLFDAVFARADAARLAAPLVVVTQGGQPCAGGSAGDVVAVDVEGDGRSVRVDARCEGAGDIVVDVVGLRALSPDHRLALRVVDDAGARPFLLQPGAAAVTVAGPRAGARPSPDVVAVVVAAAIVAVGARRARPLLATLGLALLGAGCAALVRSAAPAAAGDDVRAVVHVVVRVVVAALAVAAVAIDPAPRTRGAALALGALATFP